MAKTKLKKEPELQDETAVIDIPHAEFKMVPLRNINADPNQPRKYFDEHAMAELKESIKQNGVLQPIMVRTTDTRRINLTSIEKPVSIQYPSGKEVIESDGGPVFMVVCGERRYRAAWDLELTEIPAVIRTLTDEQALEIQIIENLQRKDVHPMEEAVAFHSLKGRFSIEEIAMRIGKSGHYVAQRVKLNDLIKPFQEILFANKMKLTDAVKLCKFPQAAQSEIYKNCNIPKDWEKRKEWHISYLDNFISNQEHELDSAPFKTEDPELYQEMGPCNTCPYNSHYNKLLFPELQKKRVCHNGVCYAIKVSRNYQKEIEKVTADPDMLFVSTSYYMDNDEKAKVKTVEQLGAFVLERDNFEKVEVPEKPLPWDEYLKENDHWSDSEDYNEEERTEEVQNCKADWEQEMESYKEDVVNYEEAKAGGRIRKAFVICGHEQGKYIDIILKNKKGAGNQNAIPGNDEGIAIDMEIAEIQDREKRNKELDREKVFAKSMAVLKETIVSITDPLLGEEWLALTLLIIDNCYPARDLAHKIFSVDGGDYEHMKLFSKLSAVDLNSDAGLEKVIPIIRTALFEKLVHKDYGDINRYGKAAAMDLLAKRWIPHKVKIINEDQAIKANKRAIGVNARLKALKEKKAALQPKELQAAAKPEKAIKSKTKKAIQ